MHAGTNIIKNLPALKNLQGVVIVTMQSSLKDQV